MRVREIVERSLDNNSEWAKQYLDAGFTKEQARIAMTYHLEIFFCNMLELMYVKQEVLDMKDKKNRRFMIRPDIWQKIEDRMKKENTLIK